MKRIFLLFTVLLCLFGAAAEASPYTQTEYRLTSPRVNEPLRIVLIADLHDSSIAQPIIQDVTDLQPQLILLAGDMINSDTKDTASLTELCSSLSQIAPVYAVPGNHERSAAKNFGGSLRSAFESGGAVYLTDDTACITIGSNILQLIGISETSVSSWKKKGGRDLMRSLPDDYEGLRICMAHVPYLFKNGLEYFEYDLAVAGHVQGGVIQLPGIGGLYSHEEGFFPEYSGGSYTLVNGATLVVSRGLDASEDWYKYLRVLGNSPELVVIDIAPGGEDPRTYCTVVNAEGSVNVRAEPSLSAEVLTRTSAGERHVLTGSLRDGWYPVRVHGREGYISADYISVD